MSVAGDLAAAPVRGDGGRGIIAWLVGFVLRTDGLIAVLGLLGLVCLWGSRHGFIYGRCDVADLECFSQVSLLLFGPFLAVGMECLRRGTN